VQSLVQHIIMPLITPLLPGTAWETATLTLGPFVFGIGPFLSALLNFILIALVVFWLSKVAQNAGKSLEKVGKAPK